MSAGAGSSGAGSSSSTDGSKVGPPNETENERLIREFVLITKTDSKCATFFLENHNWKLQDAVPDFFNLAGEIMIEKPELTNAVRSERWARDVNMGNHVTSTFTFLSWNIDGLDDRNFQRRTDNLINILIREKADIVFLQEVVPLSLNQIRSRMTQYECIMQQSSGGDEYFLVTLLKKDTVKYLSKNDESFSNSVMGRGILSVEVQLGELKLWLHNTHLESTADFKEQRVQQLRTAFAKLIKHAHTHSSILAGDMNLRDAEVGLAGGIPVDVMDLWEACDKREICRYTWDSSRNSNCLSKGGGGGFRGNYKPRLRFDRAYLHVSKSPSQPKPQPTHFGLEGIEKVPNMQCYTSDHWAIQVYFTINKD